MANKKKQIKVSKKKKKAPKRKKKVAKKKKVGCKKVINKQNGNIRAICGDCIEVMSKLPEKSVEIVITSPPYNLGIKYNKHKDNMSREDYLTWLWKVFSEVKRVLKPDGSFFLNMGYSNIDPWVAIDVANQARKHFILQNNIQWIKSVSISEDTFGQYKPINSKRFLNITHENLFHFTKTGKVELDREAIGVPYSDKSNITRKWKKAGKKDKIARKDLHCRGNCWHIPYKTIQSKKQKGNHPAIFPEDLVEWCIRLHGRPTNKTTVLDPFVGTGTTVVVAKKLGIGGIGIDKDKTYIDYTNKRLGDVK